MNILRKIIFKIKENPNPVYEFHIAREIRKKYDIDESLFSISGNVIFVNFRQVRLFTDQINKQRDNENKIRPGQVNAAGLLDEIFHYLLREYEEKENPGVFGKAYKILEEKLNVTQLQKIIEEFITLFPPQEVYSGKYTPAEYLNSSTDGKSNKEILLEELILLHISNFNPANKKLKELFDEEYFSDKELYSKSVSLLDDFFKTEKKFGPDNQDIFEMLKTPILNNPEDLEGQLDFIKEKWKILLDEKFLKKLLSGKDLLREDIMFDSFGGGGAPTIVPKYKGNLENADIFSLGKSGYKYALDAYKDYDEIERFTQDIDWMPRVVIIAKNTYVWLDQLSKKYQRHIHRLDQIPDEELDLLRKWNFTGLWLIGIWERSEASKRIKHIMGNIDAVASAYSLYDYQIAADIGGEEAYNNLNERARARGIRLASDMVPNHTGIYSKWVIEHPEYFIQSDYPPFPGYNFTGENLSQNPDVEVRIEDGYYSRSDAAVVFQRVDKRSGDVKYIYHGNDGTNMPWNDTAQLNMLKQEVREAVIQKIMDVARKFSIIRFDAAMTLAKKHFQRLWYPQPGTGGDIPSRSDYALTRDEFDQFFPVEFWREVVDRINNELPDTLLLAEAFWLLEGYFVRTLGMHRVYNSAFMHMMMKEENEKYRDLITNTLEFEPEILKRYVNFMSNPDEETAIRQFGTEDKYFGVALLMITLPGLPMFAHGQIEGYTEKYGMEYKRAYYNESPNQWLVERHERELFPLMQKRYLFSQVYNFWFFDFYDNYGNLNENVFAFTNMEGNERALIFYNNKYDSTAGKIFRSTPKLDSNKNASTKTLSEALNINTDYKVFYIFRERISGLQFIKSGQDIAQNGFYVELQGFKYNVFLDFEEVYDESGKYFEISQRLNGSGHPDIKRAVKELDLAPVHTAFRDLFDDKTLSLFTDYFILLEDNDELLEIDYINNKFSRLMNEIKYHFQVDGDIKKLTSDFEDKLKTVGRLNSVLINRKLFERDERYRNLYDSMKLSPKSNYRENEIIFMIWLLIRKIGKLFENSERLKNNFVEELVLDTPVREVLKRLGRSDADTSRDILLINILNKYDSKFSDLDKEVKEKVKENFADYLKKQSAEILEYFDDELIKTYLGINTYEGVTYYSKENFDEIIDWLFTLIVVLKNNEIEVDQDIEHLIRLYYLFFYYVKFYSDNSEYKLDQLIERLKETEKSKK